MQNTSKMVFTFFQAMVQEEMVWQIGYVLITYNVSFFLRSILIPSNFNLGTVTISR